MLKIYRISARRLRVEFHQHHFICISKWMILKPWHNTAVSLCDEICFSCFFFLVFAYKSCHTLKPFAVNKSCMWLCEQWDANRGIVPFCFYCSSKVSIAYSQTLLNLVLESNSLHTYMLWVELRSFDFTHTRECNEFVFNHKFIIKYV